MGLFRKGQRREVSFNLTICLRCIPKCLSSGEYLGSSAVISVFQGGVGKSSPLKWFLMHKIILCHFLFTHTILPPPTPPVLKLACCFLVISFADFAFTSYHSSSLCSWIAHIHSSWFFFDKPLTFHNILGLSCSLFLKMVLMSALPQLPFVKKYIYGPFKKNPQPILTINTRKTRRSWKKCKEE